MNRKSTLSFLFRQLVPNSGTIAIVLALLWAQQAGALSFLAPQATSTTTISYQGRLSSGGAPVNGSVGMTFRIYNMTTGGSPLWTEIYPAVSVSDGLFHVLLGSVNPLPNSLFTNNDTLYLGITVAADSEMTPREQLASAPWAMMAAEVPDGSITIEKIADGAIGPSQIVDSGLSPLNIGAMAYEMVDQTPRNTSSTTAANFGDTSIQFQLADASLVYIYLRGALKNPGGNCQLSLMIDGVDYLPPNNFYLEVYNSEYHVMGAGMILSLGSGDHEMHPRFRDNNGLGQCSVTRVGYGYIVLGLVP